MPKGVAKWWRRRGRVERTFLVLLTLFLALYLTGLRALAWPAGIVTFLVGVAAAFQLARRLMRRAIWRLRNRLIAAYLFIAVVPIVLLASLAGIAGWMVIGQMAAYLVNTELRHREMSLLRPAEALLRVPIQDTGNALMRFGMMSHEAFPGAELLITGEREIRYPAHSTVAHPPSGWGRASGLVVRREGGQDRLYTWAHLVEGKSEITVLAPVTHEVLSQLVPGLGDVALLPLIHHSTRVPEPRSLFDFSLTGFFQPEVLRWEAPHKRAEFPLILAVATRASAVLATVFQQPDWAEGWLVAFAAITVLYLLVEMASLVAGVQLSRSITGAVHELYLGTEHIKQGDFSYRIRVKGRDQLAELASSFNTMTANLGRLILVAKEKERLESELAIAREVQDQLFPKDVPASRTLELKGLCNPARMVSGDYYDFMPLSENALAFAIGDVAGKGISAALLMAAIQSIMRTQLSTSFGGPFSAASLVSRLNRQLYANTAPEKYATFFFTLYDETSHALTYTNAGHLSPLLLHGGEFSSLEPTGTVVGAFPAARYQERSVNLEPGDLLVAYTDGIVEPENAYGEMFGDDRLKELMVRYSAADSSELIARTMEAVNQWTGSSELQDDMTMVVARRL
jgi:sigma-B regulation protein RsbU (phosphoserine phosphatase)